MRKAIKDPQVYFILGLLGLLIVIPSKNIYVNTILIPMFFLLELISVILIIRKYLNEKKDVKDISKLRLDISLRMTLLSMFASLLSVVSSIVLIIILNKGNLEFSRYFIFFTCCIQVVIVVVSIIVLLKMLVKKNEN